MSERKVIIFSPRSLTRAMEARGVSKMRVSRELGFRTTTKLYKYLNGEVTPTTDTLSRIATIVGCDVTDFFE